MNNQLDNKTEIFKLTLCAGSEKFSDEQIKFIVACFLKTEDLTKGLASPTNKDYKPKNYGQKPYKKAETPKEPKGTTPKPVTSYSIFMREKMAELKPNQLSFALNKQTALDAWNSLSVEEKKTFLDRALVTKFNI